MNDRYAERIVRIEETLLAIYGDLPVFIKRPLATTVTNAEAGITVEESIEAMRDDIKRFNETGQI